MGVPVETGGGRVNVGGVILVSTISFARLANTTQYTATDVVSSNTVSLKPFVFKDCVRFPGGTGIIYSALLIDSVDAATNPNFDLVLFDTGILTVAGDNLTSTVTDAEAQSCVAAITFDGTTATNVATVGANLIVKATGLGQAFKCAEGSRDLYAIVIDRGGYTPASGEVFTFRLGILAD